MSGLPNCVARAQGSSARIWRDAESGPRNRSHGLAGAALSLFPPSWMAVRKRRMAATRSAEERHLAYLARAKDARLVALLHRHDGEACELWGHIADEWQHLAEQVLRMQKI